MSNLTLKLLKLTRGWRQNSPSLAVKHILACNELVHLMVYFRRQVGECANITAVSCE